MAVRIKSKKDFNAGLMFIVIGAIFSIGAFGVPALGIPGYPMGSALRMGPAYFPSILGALVIILGAVIFFDSFFIEEAPPRKTEPRGLLFILGAVVVFGLLVGPLNGGLIFACLALMMITAFGGYEFRWVESIVNAVFLTAASVGIFHYGLGLPFRLWPWSY